MPETIKCPNCSAPVVPDEKQPTVACGYCKFHFKNPIYRAPRGTRPRIEPSTSPGQMPKYIWVFVLVPIFLIIAGVVVSVVVGLSSASVAVSTTNALQAAVNSAAQRQQPAALSPEEALERKLDSYISCMQRAYPRAKQSMERYLSWAKSPSAGPTCKERYVSWGLYSMYDNAVPTCRESVAQANAWPPPVPQLHQAAQYFVSAAAKVAPVMGEAEDYYSKKMYTVDDCAKGKRLHPQLMSAYNEMTAAYQTMARLLEHYGRGALDRCLARTAADPTRVAGHNWANVVKLGGQMIEAFRSEAAKKKPDLEVIKKHIAVMNEAAAALDALSKQQKDAAGYDWTDTNTIDDFVQGAVAFLNSKGGKKLGHSARFFLRAGHDRATVEGTFEKLVVLYNEVLDDYEDNAFCGSLLPCSENRCPAR